jgi:hypothetical protein
MVWPFKRRLTDEEFIAVVGQLCAAHGEMIARYHSVGVSRHDLEPVFEESEAFRKAIPKRKAYRAIHLALGSKVVLSVVSLDCLGREEGALGLGERDEAGEEQRSREYYEAGAIIAGMELKGLMEGLPESDPIRRILSEWGARVAGDSV